MFTDKKEAEESKVMKQFMRNVKNFMIPVFFTAMAGTITYPIAVRLARSKYLFKLRNFYAIHISIAPFLAFIHLNLFSLFHTYFRITTTESDYAAFIRANPAQKNASMEDYGQAYERLKKKLVKKDWVEERVQKEVSRKAKEIDKVKKERREEIEK